MRVFVTDASGSSGQLAERVEIDNATDSLRSMIMQRTASSRSCRWMPSRPGPRLVAAGPRAALAGGPVCFSRRRF